MIDKNENGAYSLIRIYEKDFMDYTMKELFDFC